MSVSPPGDLFLASGPLLVLLAVLLVLSCLPDSTSGNSFSFLEPFLATGRSTCDGCTCKHIGFTIGKPVFPGNSGVYCFSSSRRLRDVFLLPFRLSKTLLEGVWDALRLLSGVAEMSLGALRPLLGRSWRVLASLLLVFQLVWLASLSFP